jgi:anti-sigma regulatory factor (Ser/Thr protein kinase)
MEELFTNMVKYNPNNSNDILLDVSTDDESITVSLTDYDVDAFDVTATRDVNVSAPLEHRKPGGLGLHLIQKMVDTLKYEYSDRQSTVTFTKGSG